MKIEWNKVTWYSKMIALVLFVALPFIGFYYGMNYGEMIAPLSQIPATAMIATSTAQNAGAAYYNTPSEWQTDANNTAGGFSLAYPIDFNAQDNSSVAPSTDWRLNANNTSGIKYFSLTVPSAFEPQTNLADVTLTVGGSKNNNAIARCLTADQSGGPAIATSSAMINGVTFTIFKSSNVGAGNIYQTTSYRTLHAGECYAMEYTVHSSQIGNYPSSYNLQQYNEATVDSLMQNIIGTFKFL